MTTKTKAMKFEEIPAWAIEDGTRSRYTVATAFELAGVAGRWVRLTADSQRDVFGHNIFGKCKVKISETGIEVVRSVCFGTDWSGATIEWASLERYMATGEKPVF